MKRLFYFLTVVGIAALTFGCEPEPVDPNVQITTAEVTEITETSAVSGGNITYDGGAAITVRGICWAAGKELPTVADNKTEDGKGAGEWTSNITGLEVGTIYYVRAYAQNTNGVWYGEAKQFTTLSTVPVVTTTAMSNVTFETATTGGTIVANGGEEVTACGVCWGTTENPDLTGLYTIDEPTDGVFVSEIDGLEPDMTYYVRAYATNSKGTAYGNQITFSTSTEPTITVEDPALQAYLIENFDLSNDGKLQISEAEEIVSIEAPERGITTIAGIEQLTALKELHLQYNNLTSVDLSKNPALEIVWLFNNPALTTINTAGLENLKYLHAYETALTSVNIEDNIQLIELNVHHTALTEINVANNPQLAILAVQFTNVKNIDVSNHTALSGLWADNSSLETLNIQGCTALTECYVQQSRVQNVDASGLENLKFLWCWERQEGVTGGIVNVDGCKSLTHLFAQGSRWDSVSVTGCESLQVFNAYWTNTKTLDVSALVNCTEINLDQAPLETFIIPENGFPALVYLNIHGNKLSSFDLKNSVALKWLHCGNATNLTSINVSGCSALEEAYVMQNPALLATDFSNLPALKVVWQFQNSSMKSTTFEGSSNLYYMDMDSSPVECDMNFVDMPNLWQTICWGTNVGKVTYKNCPALDHINYEDINLWEGNSVDEITFENCPLLRDIRLINTNLTEVSMNLPGLVYLAVRDSRKLENIVLNTPLLNEFWGFTCNFTTVDVSQCADHMIMVNLDNNVNCTTLYKRANQIIDTVALNNTNNCEVVAR